MPTALDMNDTPVAISTDLKSRLRLHQQLPSQVEDEKHDFIVYLPPMYDEQPDRRGNTYGPPWLLVHIAVSNLG